MIKVHTFSLSKSISSLSPKMQQDLSLNSTKLTPKVDSQLPMETDILTLILESTLRFMDSPSLEKGASVE